MKPLFTKNAVRLTTSASHESVAGDWLRIVFLTALVYSLRYCFGILFVLTTAAAAAQAQSGESAPREVLRFKVQWSFIRIGTVVMTRERCGSDSVLLRMDVRSAAGLPFIDVRFVNESLKRLNDPAFMEARIVSGRDTNEQTIYRCLPGTSFIVMRDFAGKRLIRQDSVVCDQPSYDAMGLLALSRAHAREKRTITVPTLNDYRISDTELRFTGASELIRVSAFQPAIRCRRVEGNAHWVGASFAGMKGPFSGWISDDSAAIPVRAEVKIFLGSIVLELESFEREGWNPGTTVMAEGAQP